MEPTTTATPTPGVPPVELAWGAEPEDSAAPADRPAAASWPRVVTLAGSILAVGAVGVGAAWFWTRPAAVSPVAAPPSVAPAPPVVQAAAPPPVTVTVTQTAPSAVPQVPAAAQEICDMLRRYPGMYPVDVALTLSDRTPHRPYDTTRPIVDNAIVNYCPDQDR